MRARSDTKLWDVIRPRNLEVSFQRDSTYQPTGGRYLSKLNTEMGRREGARTSYKIEISRDLVHGATKLSEDITRASNSSLFRLRLVCCEIVSYSSHVRSNKSTVISRDKTTPRNVIYVQSKFKLHNSNSSTWFAVCRRFNRFTQLLQENIGKIRYLRPLTTPYL